MNFTIHKLKSMKYQLFLALNYTLVFTYTFVQTFMYNQFSPCTVGNHNITITCNVVTFITIFIT